MPQLVQTMPGPKAFTGISSGHGSALILAWCQQWAVFEQ
jgi:hypothetical protein